MQNLHAIFYPKSIAIIGASSREKTVGNDVVKNLVKQGYKGKIFPINPKIDKLYGKKVYHDISEIDHKIDLAIVAIPAKFVPDVMAVAADKGIKAAIVISAGFKEMGNRELEDKLQTVCQQHGIALVGPNCLGAINPEIKMNASFAALMPQLGNIAFMSQSGALCTAVLDYAEGLGVGFSKFVSLGNKADVQELDLIQYLIKDKTTEVILMYIESLSNAAEFIKTVKKLNHGPGAKPIIALKSGKTEEGAGAIASHTGSLAGGDSAYDALFTQAGIIRADSINELFNLAQVFSKNELQQVDNVTIITNAGGPGVLTTDSLVESGLHLAKLSAKTTAALKKFLPPAANTHNPVDILGDAQADRYQQTLEIVAKDQNTDAILLILTPQSMTEIEKTAKAVIKIKKQLQKPIVVSFMGEPTVEPGLEILSEAQVATTAFPEPAAESLAAFGEFADWLEEGTGQVLRYRDVNKKKVAAIFDQARQTGKTFFPEAEAIEILKAYKFPVLKSKVAHSAAEAKKVAKKLVGSSRVSREPAGHGQASRTQAGHAEKKLAMKIVSQDIFHKSDVGGVMLNVTASEAAAKYSAMMKTVSKKAPKAKLAGVLFMEMAPNYGQEEILGASKTPGFGTSIMFGAGGVYVEIIKDVSFSIAPITKKDAKRMISSLRSAPILKGARGQKAYDIEKIVECLGRLSQLVTDFPEIVELDINPLLVLPKGEGVRVLDARVRIEEL